MSIKEEETIWFPRTYGGRTDAEYIQVVFDISLVELTKLVQKRAQEDGEWAIANGHVGANGENEAKMRRMMGFVADSKNIQQCVGHILKAGTEKTTTVDWVCRDLANASKWMVE